MDVLFLIPPSAYNQKKTPVDRVYGCNYGYDYKPAIHLLLLATVAEQLGHKVRFLDCPAEGLNIKKFFDYIRSHHIDAVIFFTVWLSANEDLWAVKIISDKVEKVKIVFIGAYPTWKPEFFIKDKNYFVIRGEPEETLKELLSLFQSGEGNLSGIKGLSFLENDKIVNNSSREPIDINCLPIPNRKLLRGKYCFNRINAYPSTVICVSRGCSYNCTYCAPHALDQAIELEYSKLHSRKPTLRLKSVENTVKELREISFLGYRGIEICDNQFVWDKARTMEICNAIQPLQLSWICYARADHLKDIEMLRAMRRAGCKLIYVGTESFCQEILDDINKEMSVKDSYKAVKLLREVGIEPEVSVLMGASRLETEKTILYTIQESQKLKTNFVHYSIASPLPNTHLYKIAKEKGWIRRGEFVPHDNIRDALLDLPNIKAEKLRIIIRKCYARQYLSLHFISQQVRNPYFFKRFMFKLKSLVRLIRYTHFSYKLL